MIFDTILFDLDDTIHDRNKTLSTFAQLFGRTYLSAMDEESLRNLEDIFFQVDWRGYRPREEMFTEFRNRISWKRQPSLKELMDFWNEEFPKCAEPMDGLYEVLDCFLSMGINMGIVTNGESKFQNTKLDKLKLRKYMKTILISEEVKLRKPEIAIFNLALSSMNSCRENTLFVGDNVFVDIKGARDAGLSTAWVSSGEIWKEAQFKPDYIINDIKELRKILFEQGGA